MRRPEEPDGDSPGRPSTAGGTIALIGGDPGYRGVTGPTGPALEHAAPDGPCALDEPDRPGSMTRCSYGACMHRHGVRGPRLTKRTYRPFGSCSPSRSREAHPVLGWPIASVPECAAFHTNRRRGPTKEIPGQGPSRGRRAHNLLGAPPIHDGSNGAYRFDGPCPECRLVGEEHTVAAGSHPVGQVTDLGSCRDGETFKSLSDLRPEDPRLPCIAGSLLYGKHGGWQP
jgi:hypothetical protein